MTRRVSGAKDTRNILKRAHQHPSTCPTRKLQYPSENEASRALRNLKRTGGPDVEGLVVYRCKIAVCRRFHTGHGLGTDP